MTGDGNRLHSLTRRRFLEGLGLAAAGLATACSAPTAPQASGSAPAQSKPAAPAPTQASAASSGPRKGGDLRIALGTEPATLNPGITGSQFDVFVTAKIFDALVSHDFEQKEHGQLAERWELAPDGRKVTFTLRNNVKWHDGTPFTSADVKFSVEEIWPKYSPGVAPLVGVIASVDALNPQTAVFNLKAPSPGLVPPFPLLSSAWAPIVPKHIYQGTDPKTNLANSRPVGNGPYKFKQWVKGEYIELVRNEDYWDKDAKGNVMPYLDRVLIRIIPDAGARTLLLEKGEVDYIPFDLSYSDIDRLSQNKAFKVITGHDWRWVAHGLLFNTRRKPWSDINVRKAIMHAIDQKRVIQIASFGLDGLLDAVYPDSSPWYASNLPKYPFNVDQANKLLDQAGVTKGQDGVRLRTTYRVDGGYAEVELKTAEVVRDLLKQVGIEVQVIPMERAAFLDQVYARFDFDIGSFAGSMGPDPDSAAKWYKSYTKEKGTSFFNPTGWGNARVDELYGKGATEADPTKRKAIYAEIQQILFQELPFLFLREDAAPRVVRTDFPEAAMDLFSGRGDNLAKAWWVKGAALPR